MVEECVAGCCCAGIGLAAVSVQLFPSAREKLLGVCRAVAQFEADRDRRRLIVMGSGLQEIAELSQLSPGRVFRKVGRRAVLRGTGRHLVAFLDAARVGLLEDKQDFESLEFQSNVVGRVIGQLRVKHGQQLLTESEWGKLKVSPPSSLRIVFGFVQHEAFRAIYRRGEFYLLGICADGWKDFPFPDARGVSEEACEEVRAFCELPPCCHC
jgi:hypothetical protein